MSDYTLDLFRKEVLAAMDSIRDCRDNNNLVGVEANIRIIQRCARNYKASVIPPAAPTADDSDVSQRWHD